MCCAQSAHCPPYIRKQEIVNQDDLVSSLKSFVESDLWPRKRGLDEPLLLLLREPSGAWEEHDIFLTGRSDGHERNKVLTVAMRQAVAKEAPYAAAVIAETRKATNDPNAHYDIVMATLETKDATEDRAVALFWKLGLDDTKLSDYKVGSFKAITLGSLFKGADEFVEHWVYARTRSGKLELVLHGGSLKANPMSVQDIKLMVYGYLCSEYGVKLKKSAVLKSLIVSYRPLVTSSKEKSKA